MPDLLNMFLFSLLWKLVLHVGVLERFPSQLMGLEVNHSAPAHGRWGSLLEIGRFENHVHVRRHLNDFAAHETQLFEDGNRFPF